MNETTEAARVPGPSRSRLRSALLLATTLVVAGIGPALVVYDRWLELRSSHRNLSAFSDRFRFLKDLSLPDYAALIVAAFLLLLVLGAFRSSDTLSGWRGRLAFARRPRRPTSEGLQRRVGTGIAAAGAAASGLLLARLILTGHEPGLELSLSLMALALGMLLREVSIAALGRVWARSRASILSIAAAHVAVILAFASHDSYHRFQAPLTGLALLALVNLAARSRKTGPVPMIVLAFVCLYLWRVNAWWFALVGDEYRNYEIAAQILSHDAAYVRSHLFLLEGGLEGLDPFADSLVQAAAMRVLGVNSFGWRFSSLYLAAIALAFFHRFFRTFLTRRAALASTVCLGASHYIIAFGKIGYDKFQAYLAMALLLSTAACAIRTRRMIAFVGVGFSAALCFYVYPAALYIVPLPFFLLLLYCPPFDRATLLRWAMVALVAALTIYPLPFQPGYFEGKRPGTVFYTPELASSAGRLLGHFARNLTYAIFSPLLLASEDHFVTTSYVDPVTGLLWMVGLASLLWLVRRDGFTAFLVVSLGWLMFFAGSTHDREFPPTTRMFLLLPLFVLMATAGLWRLLGLARAAGASAQAASAAVFAVLAAVVVLNVVQAHVVSVRRSDGYQLFDPLIVRLARNIEAQPPPRRVSLLLLSDSGADGSGLPLVLDVYSLQESARRLREIAVGEAGLSPAERSQVADPENAIIVSLHMDPERRARLEAQIAATGKRPCSARTTTGQERFKLWASPDRAGLCAE